MPVGLHGCCVCVWGLLDASKATFFRLRQGLTGFISARRVVQQPGGGGGWMERRAWRSTLACYACRRLLALPLPRLPIIHSWGEEGEGVSAVTCAAWGLMPAGHRQPSVAHSSVSVNVNKYFI